MNNTLPPQSGVEAKITNVVPASGPLTGDIAVEILGEYLDAPLGGLTVTFGDVVLTPDEHTSDRVVVTIPPGAQAGPVDVSLKTLYGTVTSTEAFTYEPREDMWGAYADLFLFDYVNPDQFEIPPDDVVDGFAILVEPIEIPLVEPYTARDQCEFNPTFPDIIPNGIAALDVGSSVQLSSTTSTVTLQRDNVTGGYLTINSPSSGYVAGNDYSLIATGGTGLGTFDVTAALETLPNDLSVTSPDFGVFDQNNGFTDIARNSALSFTWTGTPGDLFAIELFGYDIAVGDYINEVIICDVIDDGSFTVPAAMISQMTDTDIIAVQVGRAKYRDFDFEPTNSFGQSLTFDYQIGALEFPP